MFLRNKHLLLSEIYTAFSKNMFYNIFIFEASYE